MSLHDRIETIDGTATVNEDYIGIDEILTFQPGEVEKQVCARKGREASGGCAVSICVVTRKRGGYTGIRASG